MAEQFVLQGTSTCCAPRVFQLAHIKVCNLGRNLTLVAGPKLWRASFHTISSLCVRLCVPVTSLSTYSLPRFQDLNGNLSSNARHLLTPVCWPSPPFASLHPCTRLLDQKEKEDFEARLRSRDEERTKKLAEDSTKLTKAEQKEEAKRK